MNARVVGLAFLAAMLWPPLWLFYAAVALMVGLTLLAVRRV